VLQEDHRQQQQQYRDINSLGAAVLIDFWNCCSVEVHQQCAAWAALKPASTAAAPGAAAGAPAPFTSGQVGLIKMQEL
jgi:hypothetical protein